MSRLKHLLQVALLITVLVPHLSYAKAEAKEEKEEEVAEEGAEGEGEGKAPKKKALYVQLEPAFVTNLLIPDRIRYFRTDVTIKALSEDTKEAIKQHNFAIRHHLVMLFSRQTPEDLASAEGRKQLQIDATAEVLSVLESENSPSEVEEVLFTTFVME